MPTPVSYDPFAAPARAPRGVPVSYDPFAAPASGAAQTRPRAASPALPQGRYGSEIEREALSLDPSLRVTGRERTAARNRQVRGVPDSAHLTDNARDFGVGPGETLEQARARLEKTFGPRGYKVLAEGTGAAHSTGPHLHIEATPSAQDFGTPVSYDPFAAPAKPSRGTPVAYDPFAAPAPKPRREIRGLYGATALSAPAPRTLWQRTEDAASDAFHNTSLTNTVADAVMGHFPNPNAPVGDRRSYKDVIAAARQEAAAVSARREKADPAWRPGWLNLPGNLAREGAEIVGGTVGDVDPTYLVGGPGKTLAGRAAFQGGFQGFRDSAQQLLRMHAGQQEKFDPYEASGAAAGGAVLHTGGELAGAGGKLLRGASRAGEAGEAAKAALPAEVRGRHIVEDQVNQMRNAALRAHHKLEPLYKAFQGDNPGTLRDTVAHLQRDATPEASAPGMAAASRIGPHRVAASDTLREVLDQTGKHLNEITGTPLRKGYYPGAYLDAGKEGSVAGVARGGSRSQYKRKSYETQAEAVADGRVPKFEHPVEAVSNYVERTYRNLGLRAAVKALEEEGIAKEVPLTRKGQAMVPKGWREIVPADARSGAYATHDEPTDMIHFRPGKALIAPESVANKINGLVAQGFEGSTSPFTRGAYAVGQKISDASKMLKFAGSSLAHGANTLSIGVTDRMLSGVNALLRYKGWANAKDAPASFARNALPWRGGAAMRDRIVAGPEHMDEIDRAFEAAGGRVGATPDYDLGKAPGVAGPLARGAAGEPWAGKVKGAFNALADETKRAYAREVREHGATLGTAKFTQGQLNAVLRDANALVFEKAIPLDKMALYRMRMEAWRSANPGASLDALHAQARKSVTAVDDMLGEIPLEKLMDSRRGQQLARMLLLAPSWVVGNLRAAGKGAAEIAGAHGWKEGGLRGVARESLPGRLVHGEGMGEHTQALAALMASRYIEGEVIAQIFHHLGKGASPQTARDFERPQTGGKNGYGAPERARFVSAGNDAAIDWRTWEKVMSGDPTAPTVGGYVFSKLNGPVQVGMSETAGRDLGDPTRNAPLAGRQGEYLKGQFNPIPAEGAGRLNKSSAIPGWATLLGISQAGEADSDPDTAKGMAAKREDAAAKAKAYSDAAKAAGMAN